MGLLNCLDLLIRTSKVSLFFFFDWELFLSFLLVSKILESNDDVTIGENNVDLYVKTYIYIIKTLKIYGYFSFRVEMTIILNDLDLQTTLTFK